MKKNYLPIVACFVLVCGILFFQYYSKLKESSGSSKHAIIQELMEIYGESYSGKIVATQIIDQKEVVIKEDMDFFVEKKNVSPWNDSMPSSDSNGIPFSKAKWMTVYECGVEYVRYIMIDNKVKENSERNKQIVYLSYEDNDLNSEAKVFLDCLSAKITYGDSEVDFEDIDKMF